MKIEKKLKFSLVYDENVESYFTKNNIDYKNYHLTAKTLDARGASRGKKPSYHYEYILIEQDKINNEFIHELVSDEVKQKVQEKLQSSPFEPIIIGLGPAGLFAAYTLMKYGVKATILERGKPVHSRMRDIAQFWRKGKLDSDSNVCFGHGGAGLFSDGKLITRVKSPYIKNVMSTLVSYGAHPSIVYESNPHLGSNKIRKIIENMVEDMERSGHDFLNSFNVNKLQIENKMIHSLENDKGEKVEGTHFLLAAGHSATNLYYELNRNEVALAQKDFAIGVRIEHPRKVMQKLQYGDFSNDERLPTVRYRLSYHDHEEDRGGFSFCMCPGGYVLSSGTDVDGLVTNGMSNSKHNSPWSNSAIVCTIKAGEDFDSKNLMSGLEFQRNMEKTFYNFSVANASGKEIPACYLTEFMHGKLNSDILPTNSCPSGVVKAPLYEMLPAQVTKHLRQSFEKFNHQIKGFIHSQAILYAPETRTSSPLMIKRDKETLKSLNVSNLFPAGEGAGYAGGITSAA
ncbi:hypothetical protein N9N67_06880, partial [Bacteriovoracaceae bacterium]|nr:hypothetical protein [Bacteriovoracaceae bacterium]